MAAWNRIGKPEKELFTVEAVMTALRLFSLTTEDETLLRGYIRAAREYVENVAGISILKQRWRYSIDSFPNCNGKQYIELPRCAPRDVDVPSVTSIETFVYYDSTDNLLKDMGNHYQLDSESRPPRIYPYFGESFPSSQVVPNAVTIEFTAGTEDVGEVPETLKLAVLFMIAHFFDNREPVILDQTPQKIPYALEVLICHYRMYFRAARSS